MEEVQNTAPVQAAPVPEVEKSTGTQVLEEYKAIFSQEFSNDVIAFFDKNKKVSGKRIRKSLLALSNLSKEVKELMKEKKAQIEEMKKAKVV